MVQHPDSIDKHDYKWWIPITFTTENNADFNDTKPALWMSKSETSKVITGMPPKDQWTIMNIQQTGYYRVNYDMNNWKLIVKQLKTDHNKISIINRAQVIDDALDLARAGLLSYEIALDVNSYLANEVEYVPWKSALNNLGYIKNLLSRTSAYGAFKVLNIYIFITYLPLYYLFITYIVYIMYIFIYIYIYIYIHVIASLSMICHFTNI